MILLDGPLGTELGRRGVPLEGPGWSARAIRTHPEVIAAIHRDYAAAGATVHTAATFRTRRRAVGEVWEALSREAVTLARSVLPPEHRLAGSVAPLEDCYRPDLSPPDPRPEHEELARVLVDAGVDLLLCETFPHVGEALAAVDACVATGVETWVAFTAGPRGDLLTPAAVRDGAREAARRGASAVLVNCVPATDTLRFVEALGDAGVATGAYANAGTVAEGIGWGATGDGPRRYADIAASWVEAGARIVGGCCGTGPAHVAALTRRLVRRG